LAAAPACHDSTSTADAGPAPVVVDAAPMSDAGVLDAADEPDAELSERELIDRGITLLEEVGSIVQANITDCAKMAELVEKYRAEHLDRIRETDQIYWAKNREDFDKLKSVFHDRYWAAWKRIRPGIMKCKDKPRMREVLSEIWGDVPPDAGM
jgi:hypothetical protein